MNKKPFNLKNLTGGLCFAVLLALFAWHFIIPHSLDRVMPGFDPEDVTDCIVYGWQNEVTPPLTVEYTDYVFSFEPGSEAYDELVRMLQATKYRKQLGNLIDTHSHSITLNPHAEICFAASDGTVYEFSLLGREMRMSSGREQRSFSPRGGTAYQEAVIDFIFQSGTLLEMTTI